MRSFDPRPDQLETIAVITAALTSEGTRATAVLPCGYGKTFVAQQAAEQLTSQAPDPLILVAVPNLVLVDQMIRDWQDNASDGYAFTALPVNSKSGRRTEDEITGIAVEGVTSDIDVIAGFLAGTGRRVVFSTYQSMDTIAEAVRKAAVLRPCFAFDLAIADEAHRTAGPVRGAEPSVYKTILDDGKIPARRRAFYTATPRVASKKADSDEHPYSMGNEATYGQTVVNKSLTWAQEQGLLAGHDVFVVNVHDDGLHRLLETNRSIRVDGSTEEARMVAAAIALAQTARHRNLCGVITYHSSIANAQAFQRILATVVDTLPETEKPRGNLLAGHVNGSMPSDERAAQLALLDAENRNPDDWAVVTNCNCLSEGVNIPSMDAVVFVDPRKSLVNIVQAIGRPLRRDHNRPNKRATILIPAYIGSAQSAEEAIEDGGYEAAFQVVKALAEADETLADAFRNEALGSSRRPAVGVASDAAGVPSGHVTVISPVTLGNPDGPGGGMAADWSSWYESLKAELLDRQVTPWDRWVAVFADFVMATGRLPRQSETFKGTNLGSWFSNVVSASRRGELSPSRAASLLAVHPRCLDRPLDIAFSQMLATLSAFVAEHGRLPKRKEAFRGAKVGIWMDNQVSKFRKGRLPEDRAERLREVHPDSLGDHFNDEFERKAEVFARFVASNGRLPAKKERFESVDLRSWLETHSALFRDGKLPESRAQRLKAIHPGCLESRRSNAFDRGTDALRMFVQEQHRLPKGLETYEGAKVGSWLTARRQEFSRGKLLPERIAAILEVAPAAFDGIETPAAEAA